LEISGLITTLIIKEKADPLDRMIGEGKFEVGNTVSLSTVEGCVSDCELWCVRD